MKKRLLIKKAKSLRKNGYSLNEISKLLNISKSTASVWLSGVDMSLKGKKRLKKQKIIAKSRFIEYKKQKKIKYLTSISQNCPVFKEEKKYSVNDFKIFLALLFWGEGSKNERRLVFMNSDPEMIKAYLLLLRRSYSVLESKFRAILHLHEYHDKKKQVKYWSKITGISEEQIFVYDKKNSGKRKKKNYQGCISIRYGDVRILDEIFLIIKRFNKYV